MKHCQWCIRDWMTSIESPLFKEELHYTDGTGTPCYNGNISSISWKAGEEQTTRGYRFTYDGLDRMKKAEYGEGERLASLADSRSRTGQIAKRNIPAMKITMILFRSK